jgi:hypothetical protein
MACMFRLAELSGGQILVDGVDISQLGLDDLRAKIASKSLLYTTLSLLKLTNFSHSPGSPTLLWYYAQQSRSFRCA